MLTAQDALNRLQGLANAESARISQRFFKTGPGEYAEGDVFLGIKVPQLRLLAREFYALPFPEMATLLQSTYHEARVLALIILVRQFEKSSEQQRKPLFDFYLANLACINNWDLVDLSAPAIVGGWLMTRSRRPLHRLARSTNVWERRIAILATFYFIRLGEFDETLAVAKRLLADTHDLIHKAVGWMLREVGERNQAVAETFLATHYKTMPRTMLRYAIERFPEALRLRYLKGDV